MSQNLESYDINDDFLNIPGYHLAFVIHLTSNDLKVLSVVRSTLFQMFKIALNDYSYKMDVKYLIGNHRLPEHKTLRKDVGLFKQGGHFICVSLPLYLSYDSFVSQFDLDVKQDEIGDIILEQYMSIFDHSATLCNIYKHMLIHPMSLVGPPLKIIPNF